MNTVRASKRLGALVCSPTIAAGAAALATLALSTYAAAQAKHSPSPCGDKPDPQTSYGVWPGGKIPYAYEANYPHKAAVEDAIKAWEDLTGHAIDFVEDTSSNTEKVRIHDCKPDGGESWGYDRCKGAGCDSFLCPSNAAHELGHTIGLMHQFERNDRDHYFRYNLPECSNGAPAFFRSSSDAADFGPFNFQSVMMYAPIHPHHLRWDGTPICVNREADPMNKEMLPVGSCKDGPGGPFYTVKQGDGGAAIELYQGGTGWDRFRRTFGVGNPTPYTNDLVPETDQAGLPNNGLLAPDAAPAIETWGGESFAIYARTGDGRVATKSWDTAEKVWTGWTVLPAVPSANISDPAVTSWGPNRTDLAVRGGSDVFIMSTPRWGTWESLGAPPGGADSAPAITSKKMDQVMVVVRSTDDHMYFRECTAQCSGNQGTWSAWAAIGTHVFDGKPAVVSRGDKIDLVAQGRTDTVWLTEFRDFSGTFGWAEWGDEGRGLVTGREGCEDCNSPALGSHSENSLDIYVRGLDNHIWVMTWDVAGNRELETRALGGVTNTSPGVASVATPGRADVFATMPEEVFTGQLWPGVWRKTRTAF